METRAYNESYLAHAMANLGEMMDYGINHYGMSPLIFYHRFLSSGVAEQIEKGNPNYLVGHSGIELASIVIENSGGCSNSSVETQITFERSPEYWAGWILGYYHWRSLRSFDDMLEFGLDIEKVIAMYHPLHEADPEKFYSIAEKIISENIRKSCPLRRFREISGMTQKQLAEASGVSLRMIRAYEQQMQPIAKAEYTTVCKLARALGVSNDSLIKSMS